MVVRVMVFYWWISEIILNKVYNKIRYSTPRIKLISTEIFNYFDKDGDGILNKDETLKLLE